jgi:ABC-type transport system involved in multi-copper enzyme maturation permease subunit
MTALTATATRPLPAQRARRPFAPLVRADFLKLRKSRGLVVTASLMTIGVMVVFYGVLEVLHVVNAAKYGPAGGTINLGHAMFVLYTVGPVAAILVGTAIGAMDLTSGVFRELVVTGRSRVALFASRIPGGLALVVPLVLASIAIMVASATGLAGSEAAPSTTLVIETAVWLVAAIGFYFLLAVGVASVLGSRAQTIGILLAWQLAIMPLLIGIPNLGWGRDILPGSTLGHLAPTSMHHELGPAGHLPVSTTTAVLAAVAWIAVALAAGAWRTAKRDA